MSTRPNAPSGDPPHGGLPPADELAGLSKERVRELLARLETATAPRWQMGAMCYRMVMPPDRFDYVCPTCGARTLYTKTQAQNWVFQLDECRRLLTELPHRAAMTLDESSFCRKCQPAAKTPSLTLTIHYSDGERVSLAGINSDDLRLIQGFLGGSLSFSTSNDGMDPLKPHLERLRQLFGVAQQSNP